MPTLFTQVVIPHRDLILGDSAVNTFNFTGVDDVEDMVTAIIPRVRAFYGTAAPGATNNVAKYMSSEMNYASTKIKIYNAADPEPRVPVYDGSLGLAAQTALATTNLPTEVCLCASYSALVESGQNPRRRRGRIYVGPLNTAAATSASQTTARPATGFITDLAKAALDLAETNTLGASWVVWSRKNDSASIIHSGWVDNAFDTQRRRGVDPTSRTSWEVETDP